MSLGADVCARDPVVATLRSLFAAVTAEEQQRHAAGPLQGTAPRRGQVDPTELRTALAAVPSLQPIEGVWLWGWARAFAGGVGRRLACWPPSTCRPCSTLPPAAGGGDAGEVLLTLYERAMLASPAGGVEATFGLPITEHVLCRACERSTRQSVYTRFFHCVQARRVAGRPGRAHRARHPRCCLLPAQRSHPAPLLSHPHPPAHHRP